MALRVDLRFPKTDENDDMPTHFINLDEPSLRTMITKAWYSALQLELDPITDTGALVEYPIHGKYCLDQNSSTFKADYTVLMQRLNYLAKDYSKHYNASSRSIGYSLS